MPRGSGKDEVFKPSALGNEVSRGGRTAVGGAGGGDPGGQETAPQPSPLPAITLPKGGGAIRGIGEKFAANPVTGTGSFTVPIAVSPGRSGFTPQLALSYDSGSGNGPFGWGFSLSLPAITRRTDKGLPRYQDADESDIFILSGAEDLVPVQSKDGHRRVLKHGAEYQVNRYRPRTEGLFARIERWTNLATGIAHWRSISKENVTTIYGGSGSARISDPQDPTRVFSWLLEESYDDKGNVQAFEYKAEDAVGIDRTAPQERNRILAGAHFANRYLKRIKYGNRTPFRRDDFIFEVVFDYGEHDVASPRPVEDQPWLARPDAFSSYRAGFEVRTYRRCRRALMFHSFPELGVEPCLVRSTDFEYEADSPIASFIHKIAQRGYIREPDGKNYRQQAMPPVELTYSKAQIDESLHELDHVSLQNLPQGLSSGYQWIDLYREGLSGILTEQAGVWFYKPNRGGGTFGPLQIVGEKPAIADLNKGRQQLLDLAADGRNYLVQFQQPLAGFHVQDDEGRWGPFTAFPQSPQINWNDPNLKFVDLTGDGRADILITEDQVFTWHESEGTEGFKAAERVQMALDEERGPRLVFGRDSENGESIYLADMSGDGLVDLVRIRNGEVCYWPNLGYGRFGTKVTMDGAPFFDHPEQFSQRRIRLADIDGSGTTDIIYLGRDRVSIYFNQSGNSFGEARVLTSLPPLDSTVNVTTVDLLGNGTACLVFSSTLPGESGRPVRYVDLMGGQKPHLLTKVVNNLGAETHVRYTASTEFYLRDLQAEIPWITKLPFPVHCVERVETVDAVGRNRFVTRYSYHQGTYDGVEREFRGFGMVEQWDSDEFAALQSSGLLPPAGNDSERASHVPPRRTKTWFHTGAQFEGARISRQFETEYFRAPGLTQEAFLAQLLPDTILPAGLTVEEERQACRALKGSILRQELYAADGTDKASIPYTVSERNYTIEVIQPQASNRHGVFLVHPRETLTYHFERHLDDPRIGHELVLEVDDFGNVRRSATIGYGRRPEHALPGKDGEKQKMLLCTCTDNGFTNFIDAEDSYRGRMPSEARTYELTGLPCGSRLSIDEVDKAIGNALEIPYEESPTGGLQKRLIEHVRMLYRRDDLNGALPLHQVEPRALPFETHKLAFTVGLIEQIFGDRVTDAMLRDAGCYLHSEGDSGWWVPSGRIFYSLHESDAPAQELVHAERHFFLPHRSRDPFGHSTTVTYDSHDLLAREICDPVGNIVRAELDYRVLQPWHMTDPNRNRTAVRFDALGMVVATAVMGKEGAGEGDKLEDPTTRLEYDLFAWMQRGQPVFVHAFAREKHGAENPRWQESYSYSDGFGREIQKKIQAEPGPVIKGGPVVNPRWVGSGWTIFNNKGKPVRQYEPFFSATHDFEFANKVGVSPILFYDPLDRVVATLHPNHTYEKVVFDAWHQATWDVNDTVLQDDPGSDPDVGGFFRHLTTADYLPTWYKQRDNGQLGKRERAAALKASRHANTPTLAYFDTLGRPFLTVADNGPAQKYATRVELDIEGNPRSVIDARDRVVMRYGYDMLGTRIHQASMDAGRRWMLNDVAGKPIFGWDDHKHLLRTEYDALRRPKLLHLREGDEAERIVQRTVYGECAPEPETNNLRGQAFEVYDGAGLVTNERYDFKGNLLTHSRRLAVEYRQTLDWSTVVPLEDRSYSTSTAYDALNRPVRLTAPDQSVIRPIFNEANLLERIDGNLRGAVETTSFVKNIDYNAKGQRELIDYGNGVRTKYCHDTLTFRLTRLCTLRDREALQDLHYTYDPVGNIIHIRDAAQQVIFFRNQVVEPSADYNYDAIYRLIEATGREHLGQLVGSGQGPLPTSYNDAPRVGLAHPGDGNVMGRYLQRYVYDEVGNILKMAHRGSDAGSPGWTRTYKYHEPSLLEQDKSSNRLSQTTIGHDAAERYGYDTHGSITVMPHLSLIHWDYCDQLQRTAQQSTSNGTPEICYYVYDVAGQRIRKVTDHATGTRKIERIYLGAFELYREYSVDGTLIELERETLHVMDERQRLALIETRTIGADHSLPNLIRYQLSNQLESAILELDKAGRIVSYEEYYPYGGTAYQAVQRQNETPKRYRFSGKERDEENGFQYYQARYYVSWLGRWLNADPLFSRVHNDPRSVNPSSYQTQSIHNTQNGDSLAKKTSDQNALSSWRWNLYLFTRANPLGWTDKQGLDPVPAVHITAQENLPKIAAEGLKPGATGHAWLGTGVYLNAENTPFASMGGGSQPAGKSVLGTTVDPTGFAQINFKDWQKVESDIIAKVKNDPQRFDPEGNVRPGFGINTDWFKGEKQRLQREYWDKELTGKPGAYMDFTGQGAPSGRIFMVRSGFLNRIGAKLNILGVVQSVGSNATGTMWAINRNVRGFVFTAAGGATLTLAENFIPGFAEASAFVRMGGIQWTTSLLRTAAPAVARGAASWLLRGGPIALFLTILLYSSEAY